MICPAHRIGVLIGPKGCTILRIKDTTGCNVRVEQDTVPRGEDCPVTFSGGDISAAVEMVEQVIFYGPSAIDRLETARAQQQQQNEVRRQSGLLCPASRIGALIGPKGATVLGIRERTGCHVRVEQDAVSRGEDCPVTFSGGDVAAAMAMVEEVIAGGRGYGADRDNWEEQGQQSASFPGDATQGRSPADWSQRSFGGSGERGQAAAVGGVTVVCPAARIGVLIGPKGATIGRIKELSGCLVKVEQSSSSRGEDCAVSFVGGDVEAAVAMVQEVIATGPRCLDR